MKNDIEKKPSWLPIVLAIGIPALVVLFVILFATGPGGPEPESGGPSEPLGQAYVALTLEDREGEPVVGRPVVFFHRYTVPEYMGEYAEREHERTTDASGIATVTLPKTGDVTIRVEGAETERRLLALERNAEDTISLEIVLDD